MIAVVMSMPSLLVLSNTTLPNLAPAAFTVTVCFVSPSNTTVFASAAINWFTLMVQFPPI